MRTVARARSFAGDRDAFCPRRVTECRNILHPGLLVEIDGKEPTCFVCQHRVYADRPARGQTRRGHTATQGSTRMDPLACRRLGLTQVEVTQLGFGGAGLGDLFEVIPEAQAAATLEAAWDAGIRYYDTAPWYGLTQSEHRFGRALYRQPRRDFVLSPPRSAVPCTRCITQRPMIAAFG